jgi:hypothetical protein
MNWITYLKFFSIYLGLCSLLAGRTASPNNPKLVNRTM